MTTTVSTPTRTRKSKPRAIRLVLPLLDSPSVGIVAITEGKKVEEYLLWRQPSFPYTHGFRLAKMGTDTDGYDVLLDQAKPELSTCECKGFLRWGHCKHVSGLRALMTCGKVS